MERVREDEFVARAGVATLLRYGTFERIRVLRRMLAEAEEGQSLQAQGPAPIGPEEEPGEETEPDEGELDEEELDEEGHGDVVLERPAEDVPEEDRVYMLADPSVLDELLVFSNLSRWLHACPAGPVSFPGESAWGLVAALARGWASTVVQALSPGPLTLAELEGAVAGDLPRERLLGYVEDMERAGLLEARRESGAEARYAVTGWLREAMAPLVAAARLERRRRPRRTAAPDELDVRAAFALTLPRLELPIELSGSCRLGVEIGGAGEPRLSGVTVHFESGRVASVAPGLDERAGAWAIGSCGDWLDAVVEPDEARVRTGGDRRLADTVIPGLHGVLFAGEPHYESEDFREFEPDDRGAGLRRQVAAAGPDIHRAYAATTVDEVAELRRDIEADGARPVEDRMEITIGYQTHIWEMDLEMLFNVADGEPVVTRLADELIELWGAMVDAQDPDEPFI